jgi:hypothetical protein
MKCTIARANILSRFALSLDADRHLYYLNIFKLDIIPFDLNQAVQTAEKAIL